MIPVPIPDDEEERLAELHSLNLFTGMPEPALDRITELARMLCATPMSAITVIDSDHQWLVSRQGVEDTETSREASICAHAIVEPDRMTIVPDTNRDLVLAEHPAVTKPDGVRFYAGRPLAMQSGRALGTLCVFDARPRRLSAWQLRALELLADLAQDLIVARAAATASTGAEERPTEEAGKA